MAQPALVSSIFDQLLKDRIIWLGSEVRDDNANEICVLARVGPDVVYPQLPIVGHIDSLSLPTANTPEWVERLHYIRTKR